MASTLAPGPARFKNLMDSLDPAPSQSPSAPVSVSRTKRPLDVDFESGQEASWSNDGDTDMIAPDAPDPSTKRMKDSSPHEETEDKPIDWQHLYKEMRTRYNDCAYYYTKNQGERKVEQEETRKMADEILALKDQVNNLTKPDSDVVYDLKEEFKKVEAKKDQSIKAAERRYETCNAEKEQLKADAIRFENADSEWKKTAIAKDREKVESEKQLIESRAHVAALQTSAKEEENKSNALQKELEITNIQFGKAVEIYRNSLNENNGLRDERSQALSEVTRIQEDYDELYQENYELQEAYDSVRDDKERLEFKCEQLESKATELDKVQDHFKNTEEQLFNVKKAHTSAQNQLESLGTEFEQTKSQLAIAYEKIEELEKRPTEAQLIESQSAVQLLQHDCTELQKRPTVEEVAEAQNKFQQLQSRCNELEKRPPVAAQTDEGQKIIQDLRDELEKRPSEADVAEAQNRYQALQSRCNELEKRPTESEVVKVQSKCQELETRCTELEKRPSDAQVAEVESKYQEMENRCTELEKRLTESQLAELESKYQEMENRCTELEKRPTESQLTEVQNNLQALQRRCDEVETQSTEAKSGDLPSTQAALVKLQDRCNELEFRPTLAELLDTQSARTELQDRCNELEFRPTLAELLDTQSARTELQDRFDKLEKRSVAAEAKLFTLHGELKTAHDRSRKQKLQPNKGGAELVNMRQNLQKMQGQLNESFEKVSKLEADLVTARSALKDSEIREKEAVDLQSTTDVELLDAQVELTDQQARIKELEAKLQENCTPEANKEMEEKIRKLEEQSQQHSAQESTLSAVRLDMEHLQTRFKELEKENEVTKQANHRLTDSSGTMGANLVARESEVQELHSKIKTQEEQLVQAKKDLKVKKKKATVDESHIRSQDEAMSKLSNRNSALEKRCENLDQDAKDSKKQVLESEAAVSKIKEKYNQDALYVVKLQKETVELRKKVWRFDGQRREHNNRTLSYEFLKIQNEEHEALSKKVGAEYKRLEIDHRRVCNSFKTLRILHAKCGTEAPNRPEQSLHAPTNEPHDPSAEETKDLVPRNIEGEKQLDDCESILGDNASQAIDETPLDDQLRCASPGIAQGNFGGGSVSGDAVSRIGDRPDHLPGENGGTAAPGHMGGVSRIGDGPDHVPGENGGTAAPGHMGGDNGEAPSSGGNSQSSKTPTPGTGRLTLQKFQAPSFFPTTPSIIAFLLILAIACISFYFVSGYYSRLAYDAVLTRADDTTRAMLLSERMGGGTGTIWPAWLGRIMDDNVVEMIPGLYG